MREFTRGQSNSTEFVAYFTSFYTTMNTDTRDEFNGLSNYRFSTLLFVLYIGEIVHDAYIVLLFRVVDTTQHVTGVYSKKFPSPPPRTVMDGANKSSIRERSERFELSLCRIKVRFSYV